MFNIHLALFPPFTYIEGLDTLYTFFFSYGGVYIARVRLADTTTMLAKCTINRSEIAKGRGDPYEVDQA